MTRSQLLTARDYFEEVVTPAYDAFFAGPSSFQAIYAMANALYHLHEWMWHSHKTAIQSKYGVTIKTKGKLWADVIEANVADAGYIRDLNNVSKHVELSIDPKKPQPSTPMHHAANTVITTSGWGQGGYGTGPHGGTSTVKLQSNKRNIPLDPIAKRVYKYWKRMLDEFDPPPTKPAVKKANQVVLTMTGSSTPSANS